MSQNIIQQPAPGDHLLRFRGDSLEFSLRVEGNPAGQAFVRTNLGHARITRREIIRQVELNEARQGRDWFDIPMTRTSPGCYEAVLALDEVGHFEAKCLFIPRGGGEPQWPAGPNTAVNVAPAATVCGNIVYNAFVRQFGSRKTMARADYGAAAEATRKLDDAGFTVIPPSGTFRDLIAQLDFIIGQLGCRIVQLLPIHPTPTTYARMGRFGSPYAALSFTAVDPALAVFDPKATPLDQFLELVDAVHTRHAMLIIDIAINHTGWAAGLHESHPQWLVRNESGEIENPGAWGVVWADLTRLDFSRKDLWQYMADVFLTWCRRGVDGFRCDAGYMIPLMAWQYIIAKVRDQFSDVIFLLEGLGGKIQVTRDLLNLANFNWTYSELFQNYTRDQIDAYLPEALAISASDGTPVHFAETHDNDRLAANSKAYARMRTALCALTAPSGAFGFANGVEWFATEKINVHEANALNWGAPVNQVAEIGRLSRLLKTHPCFSHPVEMSLISRGQGPYLALTRRHQGDERQVIVLVNLDLEHPQTACWDAIRGGLAATSLRDLLTDSQVEVEAAGDEHRVVLESGQVCCLASMEDPWQEAGDPAAFAIPPAVIEQRLKAKALEILSGCPSQHGLDPAQVATQLGDDPEDFCRNLTGQGGAPQVIIWRYPVDIRRQVMVPPGHFLLVRAEDPFHMRIVLGGKVVAREESLPDAVGRPFVLVRPLETPSTHTLFHIEMTCFSQDRTRHASGELLFLSTGHRIRMQTVFSRDDCHHLPLLALGTNGRGAMMRVAADWRRLDNRYDALLAANLHPLYPEDRRIMLTRCRAWVVYQGFSQEVNLDGLDEFGFDYSSGAHWRYRMITGQGEHIVLRVGIRMLRDVANTVQLYFERLPGMADKAELPDDQAVTLVIRPDIEDRNFHHTTKAYTGPEKQWPAAVSLLDRGFAFAPNSGYHLNMTTDHGSFYQEPEWYYMIRRPQEAERGQDPDSDLFSPGYFSITLAGGRSVVLTAMVVTDGDAMVPGPPLPDSWPWPAADLPFEEAISAALNHFVTKRSDFNTVIAGYPWFLDWGRDTLIVARGLVADGKTKIVQSILAQFAAFERDGTLPNMIRGDDARNRDTSDAPLWFYTVCADLMACLGHEEVLKTDCAGRPLGKVLIDMAGGMIQGTPNGIVMDPSSGLMFSPAHFTWMDTNYPAGTPRQGYPIEIQALWFAALNLLSRIDARDSAFWRELAEKVKAAIRSLFTIPGQSYLCDCRHAAIGQGAAEATPDDALRPNQLLAITLGAVEDREVCTGILHACQELLVPGAIRSLADRPVVPPLAIYHDAVLLNDPQRPYWGRYLGAEDTRRKPAYHNGTAWTWLFPSFCEAWLAVYGEAGRPAARAWLSSSIGLLNWHCVGQLPEIVDGDSPHHQRGCDAQAWGVSELLRVWKLMDGSGP